MTASSNLLFSWADVEQRPELQRLQRVLDTMPDGDILGALEERRGHGRDDDPVVAMWRAMLAGIVFQHESAQSLLRELQRNSALLALCGFPALPRQSAPKRGVSEADGSTVIYLPQPLRDPAPDACNFSRFLRVVVELEEEQGMIAAMIRTMREQLMEEADDFGEFLGYDGKPWKKVKTWFGYRVHTIADTQYEIPVAASVTRASVSEVKELERLSERLFEETPALAERCKEFSADRGLDSGPLRATLWDQHRIRPLIDSRALWSAEKKQAGYDPAKPISRPLFPDRNDCIHHTERGEVICKCPATGTERSMAFQGFEADRSTLKYRCPAAACGFACEGRDDCHKGAGCKAGAFGRVVRIDLEKHSRRIFTPTPHGSPSWRRGSNRRSAMERIYSRLDNGFRFERHTIVVFHIVSVAVLEFRRATDKEVSHIASVLWSSMMAPECRTDNYLERKDSHAVSRINPFSRTNRPGGMRHNQNEINRNTTPFAARRR